MKQHDIRMRLVAKLEAEIARINNDPRQKARAEQLGVVRDSLSLLPTANPRLEAIERLWNEDAVNAFISAYSAGGLEPQPAAVFAWRLSDMLQGIPR